MTDVAHLPERIISGGQTGVDRAALDIAIKLNIPHGGWCPQGRLAEDGKIPDCYQLRETESSDYTDRTQMNVRDADGTLILNTGNPEGGTALTIQIARQLNKPLLVCDPDQPPETGQFSQWILENRIRILNVAGPRASKCPGIYYSACFFLESILYK